MTAIQAVALQRIDGLDDHSASYSRTRDRSRHRNGGIGGMASCSLALQLQAVRNVKSVKNAVGSHLFPRAFILQKCVSSSCSDGLCRDGHVSRIHLLLLELRLVREVLVVVEDSCVRILSLCALPSTLLPLSVRFRHILFQRCSRALERSGFHNTGIGKCNCSRCSTVVVEGGRRSWRHRGHGWEVQGGRERAYGRRRGRPTSSECFCMLIQAHPLPSNWRAGRRRVHQPPSFVFTHNLLVMWDSRCLRT
ncbi:hypothetical protein SCHPADRAFT_356957 [Schizopora paradoxa]|uniref:Uncharacterized protein n=1 Tax=Schizopora paradoxa TaxID=27342 RepID=A0A0H2RNR2_9AGAM|nr:hypothetical protein SCHPADRAFT_356957 [Schizopora paradoxa]